MIAAFALAVATAPVFVHPCRDGSPFVCGAIRRPLDPSGAVPGTVDVHFEWLPRRLETKPSTGVIVANEGGPGSGSTGSREAYRTLFGPLLDSRDLLLMDNRGTGRSGAIDCEPLQSEPVMAATSIANCGAQLGKTAAFYGSGFAADDLAAILDALHVRKADLYGDSYGTFFSQVFAARHPDRVRSLILDGAFPVIGDSPWYDSAPAAMRRAFDIVCRRADACKHIPGSSLGRIARLTSALRRHRIASSVAIGAATRRQVVVPSDLAMVMDASALATVPLRELDAAARAYLDGQDAQPLLRLVGESFAANESAGAATDYSRGLFLAVSCADYPQAYDVKLAIQQRHRQWRSALARQRASAPALYSPFTIDEWLAMPPDYSTVGLCLDWPVPKAMRPPGPPIPSSRRFPAVPTLVISGEFDTITTSPEGAATAALFPSSTHVTMANSAHVNAIGDLYGCASRIARRFIETLRAPDTSCASKIPELRMVPTFARNVGEMAPARPLAGNHASGTELRAAAAAAQTVGDAIARLSWIPGTEGAGLRGGTFTLSTHGGIDGIRFDDVRFTRDLPVCGSASLNERTQEVTAHLTTSGAAHGFITIRWNGLQAHAMAFVTGTLNGRTVKAMLPAP